MHYVVRKTLKLAMPFVLIVVAFLFMPIRTGAADSSRTYTTNEDFAEGILDGTEYDSVPDQLQLFQQSGTWTVVFDSEIEGVTWGTLTWSSYEPDETLLRPKGRSSIDTIVWSTWEYAMNGDSFGFLSPGRYLEIVVEFEIISGFESPVLYDLMVEADYVSSTPPVADAGGPYNGVEGTAITLDASGSADPEDDSLQYRWDLDNDGDWDTDYSADPTMTHTWADDFYGTVAVEVFDGQFVDTDTAAVSVQNEDPSATIDTFGVMFFAGGDAFLIRAGEALFLSAYADDPGADDLTFTWILGFSTYSATYPGDGQDPSSAWDSIELQFETPGVITLTLVVSDDDLGSVSADCTVLVTGDSDNTRTRFFWRMQYSGWLRRGFDSSTLQSYLDIVNFVSPVFSEDIQAGTIVEARLVLRFRICYMRGQAGAQALAAWLNFASGSVDYFEAIDTDFDGEADMQFFQVMNSVEDILLDSDSTWKELRTARNLALAVNLRDFSCRFLRGLLSGRGLCSRY